jgi:imidazolonepropionase-like amidohydrolase
MLCKILTLAVATLLAESPVSAQPSQPLAIVGATIIDGTDAEPIRNGVILVESGKIVRVGGQHDLQIPGNARRIDARGKYIIPGLIDTNVHVSGFFENELFALYTYGEEDPYGKFGYSLEGAQEGLKYGVTTMLDTYGPLMPLMKVRDRINSGEAVGPRLLVGGNIIGWGGPAAVDQNPGKVPTAIENELNKWFVQGTGVDLTEMYPGDVVKAIKRYMDLGPDFIKIGTTSHQITPPIPLTFSPEVHKAIVDAAHARGITVVVHSGTVEGHRLAVASGVNIITHADLVNQEFRPSLLTEICKSNTYFAPFTNLTGTPEQRRLLDAILGGDAETLQARDEALAARAKVDNVDRMATSHLPSALVNEVSTMKTTQVINQKRLIEGGCKIVIATDSTPGAPYDHRGGRGGMIPFYSDMGTGTLRAIEGLVKVGMSPKEALISATRRGAEAILLKDKIGTLEPGKAADLVILDDDPLRDIANIHKISEVMRDGVIIDRKALPTKPFIYRR